MKIFLHDLIDYYLQKREIEIVEGALTVQGTIKECPQLLPAEGQDQIFVKIMIESDEGVDKIIVPYDELEARII